MTEGQKIAEAWYSLSEDEQYEFILNLPYRFILWLESRYPQDDQ